MPAPAIVQELVKRFEDNRESYRSGKYNEMQLRREFLDPFLDALGWNVSNNKDLDERRGTKESMQRQIDSTDKAIDKLVYELYGLNEEEINIVEGGG